MYIYIKFICRCFIVYHNILYLYYIYDMKNNISRILKPVVIFCTGCILTGVLTWSAYMVNLKSIRSSEKQIVNDIATSLATNIQTTLVQEFMPDLIGFNEGEITRKLFTVLTDAQLELSSTSFSWVPIVKPEERESFVNDSSIESPGYEILLIDENSQIFTRPVDDADMWPLLHANPLFNEEIRGVDLFFFWKSDIERMIETGDTVIGDLFFLDTFDNILKFSNENSVYNILQPVYSLNTSEIIGIYARLFFPSEIILISLEDSDIDDVDDHQVSIFRIRSNGFKETVFVEDRDHQSDEFSEEIIFKKGTNSYTDSVDIRGDTLSVTMTSNTIPEFQTYGVILLVSIFATFMVSIMYFQQINISENNKLLAYQRKKALNIAIFESEHKSRFVSEMSHEFRTPLNGIMGMVDLIKSQPISPVVKKYMGIAESCSDIMLGLVNDILDFSKIESGHMSITRCPDSIRKLIGETMNIMRVTYRKKDDGNRNDNIILKLNIYPSVPGGVSQVDTKRVRQVIVNLVSNAFKFTNSGSIIVKAECKEDIENGGDSRLYISVTDTGIGISPEGVENLFKPFSQVHDARLIKAGGTGLGLVICKKLCMSMGGDIKCESVKDVGTVFSFHCLFGSPDKFKEEGHLKKEWDLSAPIEIKDNEEDEYIVDTSSKPVSEPLGTCFNIRSSTIKKPSIAFADDVNVNRLILDRMLAPLNADVKFAKDGLELVNLCMTKKFSVILTDIVMPIMSGTEASRIISTGTGPNRDTPIIAISGSRDELGMTVDSLMKPIARNLLYDKLSKWLSNEEVTWIHNHWKKSLE